jgi:hypothetical protein
MPDDDQNAGRSTHSVGRPRAGPTPETTPDRKDAEEDLRATGDSIQDDLKRLSDLEAVKQRLDVSDPQVEKVSDEAVTVAERIARKTRIERDLADELS